MNGYIAYLDDTGTVHWDADSRAARALRAVEQIRAILWLNGAAMDPAKEWSPEFLDDIAQQLRAVGFGPEVK